MLKRFFKDQNGATAIEFSLIATLVSLAVLGAVSMLSDNVAAMFENSATEVRNATSSR